MPHERSDSISTTSIPTSARTALSIATALGVILAAPVGLLAGDPDVRGVSPSGLGVAEIPATWCLTSDTATRTGDSTGARRILGCREDTMSPEGFEPPPPILAASSVGATSPLGDFPRTTLSVEHDLVLGGYILKGSDLFMHSQGVYNTALGLRALGNNTLGTRNTALGLDALASNDEGSFNTALGKDALFSNTRGLRNVAVGLDALESSTAGVFNVAIGAHALERHPASGANTAVGYYAMGASTGGCHNTAVGLGAMGFASGAYNTAVGELAGFDWGSGHSNVAIGHGAFGDPGDDRTIRIGGLDIQERTFIEGISGTAVSGVAVQITADDQLGVASSSIRFKEDVRDLEGVTDKLLALRPVSFRYKDVVAGSPGAGLAPLEFGLIAEEVAEVLPELVIYDEQGRPFTVRYELLVPLLLDAHQSLRAQLARQAGDLARLRAWQEEVLAPAD